MNIMITAKAKKMQMALLAISVLSILAVLFLKVATSWDGQKSNILYSWAMLIRGLPIAGIMASIVFFNIGKRVPALIASLAFTGFSIISTVNLITYEDNMPWGILIIDVLAMACSAICLLSVLDRTADYSASYIIEPDIAKLLTVFTVAIILAYYFMNFIVQDFVYIPELGAINFFGTFTVEKGESVFLHAFIAILIIVVLFFAWNKQYKLFFGINIALTLILVVMVFYNFDMPYRTIFFYILLLMIVAEIIASALIFKANLKPDLSRKKAELELLKNNGKMSEEEYLKELDKLNEKK